MSKSIIPFIFENPFLNNIFIEVSTVNESSKIFYLEEFNEKNLNTKNFNILLTDGLALEKLLKRNIQINKILLIDNGDKININFKIDAELIKINTPFKINEIYERIENNLIQVSNNADKLHKYKYFTYDPSIRELSNKLVSLRLTEKESQIFVCLVENSNPYISKKDLLYKVWSYGEEIDTHTLETHVYALRKKIEKKLNIKELIKFEEKKGYFINKSIL